MGKIFANIYLIKDWYPKYRKNLYSSMGKKGKESE